MSAIIFPNGSSFHSSGWRTPTIANVLDLAVARRQVVKRLIHDFRDTMMAPVFLIAAILIVCFVLYGAMFSKHAEQSFEAAQTIVIDTFGWFYVLSATALLVFAVTIAAGRLGSIRLGGENAAPEFGGLTWFMMLMAAGMGIGLVFFGVAEPIEHYRTPLDAEPESDGAVLESLRYAFFHWGLHPWAIYISIALPLAYFHFRYQLPLAPRSLLYPLIGNRIHGWTGHSVDILATVGTLFGIGTSLGLGAMQINAGIHRVAGLPVDLTVQIGVIAIITTIATISVVSGLYVGIRRLSQFNILLGGIILLFVIINGPSIYIFERFTTGLGAYLQHLPFQSLRIEHGKGGHWQADWTLFYWSWWIAWSPFVGIFAARISKGRTIREFIVVMLIVPTLVGFIWFAAMGGTSLHLEHYGTGGIGEVMEQAGDGDEGSALAFYAMLGELPFTMILSVLATLLIIIFFVTSSDSGSLVIVMITSGGHPNPPIAYRVFWCVAEGVVAATLLLAGGLQALRTASLIPALPMVVLLLVACFGLAKALRVDIAAEGVPDVEELKEPVSSTESDDNT